MMTILFLSCGVQVSSWGQTNSDTTPSLAGKVYFGIIKSLNPEYDKKYDLYEIIVFYSANKCRVFGRLITKGTTPPDLRNIAITAEKSSNSWDQDYTYQNEQIKAEGSDEWLLQDDGRIIVKSSKGIHGYLSTLDNEQSKQLLDVVGFNGTNCVYTISIHGIPHRGWDDKVVLSEPAQIEMLLKEDVAGYYNISEFSTEVQKRVFSQSEEYKNTYLPRLKKEKEYLLNDEYEVLFPIQTSGEDVWELDYDLSSRRFHFGLRHHETDRYKLSNESNAFHVLVYTNGTQYSLTYPKPLVSVVNGRSYSGQMAQEQTLYTCVVPEVEAAKFYPERHNSLLWRFKIEKVKNGRIYGRTTNLKIVEGLPNGTNILGVPQYRYPTEKEDIQKIVVDFTNTLMKKGANYRSVKTTR